MNIFSKVASYELRVASAFRSGSLVRTAANYLLPTQYAVLKARNSRLRTRNSSRRGILLLVVLSMLTLFLLIGTAFIVSANQYRKANKTLAKITATSNQSIDQDNLLEEVINQLVRDTFNQNSSLRFHSLLRDMYGIDGFTAVINSVGWAGGPANITGGQMIQFDVYYAPNDLTDRQNPKNVAELPVALSPFLNAYNGQVVTFLDGPARGFSTRVTSYVPPVFDATGTLVTPASFRVITPQLADGTTLLDPTVLGSSTTTAPPVIRHIAINGRPFNGTGVGYNRLADVNQPRGDMSENIQGVARPLALLPNHAFGQLGIDPQDFTDAQVLALRNLVPDAYFFTNRQLDPTFDAFEITDTSDTNHNLNAIRLKNLIGLDGLGGSDESYDVPDYQNMLLAMMTNSPIESAPQAWRGATATLSDPNGSSLSVVLPSFHRPALLNFWRQQLLSAGGTYLENEPNLLRRVLLRPNWMDHPNFDGSNPDFANLANNEDRLWQMIYGPWDVDNDNDGVRDSVWVDFGAPVMEDSDGRLVKPLAALLVLDMDGRLNLNAHGAQEVDKSNQTQFNLNIAGGTAGTLDTDNLPQGQGFGPAEISLSPLMPGNDAGTRWSWQARILGGVTDADRLLPFDAAARQFRRRRIGKYGGRDGDFFAGNEGFDLQAQLKMQGVPFVASSNFGLPRQSLLSNYGTPPDFKGRFAVPALNALGQPVLEARYETRITAGGVSDRQSVWLNFETPYEVDLSLGASRGESENAADSTYALAELERVLRAYDADAGSLPSRVWDFAGEFKDSSTQTTPNLDRLNLWRTSVTTDSYDLPVPNVAVPEWMLAGPDGTVGNADDFVAVMDMPIGSVTFADLLEYRIRAAQSPVWQRVNDDFNRLQSVRLVMQKLMPADLSDGLRIDLNRPFGNGRDDSQPGSFGYGVVDEPGEDEGAFWTSNDQQLIDAGFTRATAQFRDDSMLLREAGDRTGDNIVDNADRTAYENLLGIATGGTPQQILNRRVVLDNLHRQGLARDLYVVAMTLADPLPVPATGAPTRQYELDRAARARRMAQWAINVVDFRDPDNIMTGFEYDANLFATGWLADGSMDTTNDNLNGNNLYGADNAIGGRGANQDQGGVVWGTEAQELVMTETLAWHDRRTTDEGPEIESSNIGNPAQNNIEPAGRVYDPDEPDRDFDQLYRPRGACFVELYCPLSPNPAASADTHFIDNNGNDLGINLAGVDHVNNSSPTWRMAVYQRPEQLPAVECANWDPDAVDSRFQPSTQPFGQGQDIDPDRCIYFARFDTGDVARLQSLKSMDNDDGVEFFTTLNVPPVRPGRYMVVGSGERQDGRGRKSPTGTVYGANIGDIDRTSGPGGSKQRRIELDPNSLREPFKFIEASNTVDQLGDENPYLDPEDNSRAIVDVAVITNALSALAPTPLSRRFTITEPARGYPGDDPINYPPTGPSYVENPPGEPEGRYGNIAQRAAYDRPHDDVRTDGETRLQLLNNFEPDDPNDALFIECFSMLYLQRLANPLLPFHERTNPYRTVDGMSANVSLFNGIVGSPAEPAGETFQLDLENGSPEGRVRYENRRAESYFSSVQRGYTTSRNLGAGNYLADVMTFEPPNYGLDDNQRVRGFQSPRLNQFPPGGNRVRHAINAIPDMTLGRVNQEFLSPQTQQEMKSRRFTYTEPVDGLTPQEPFPWLTWNNRPFANGDEVLLVPRSSSSQLLKEFSGFANDNNPFVASDVPSKASGPAAAGAPAATRTGPEYSQQRSQGTFGHLVNMHLSENPARTRLPDVPANFHRVLDYVQVVSPFVGAETWLSPLTFGDTTTGLNDVNDPRYLRQPPFNKVSSYREPGRVNINTVASAYVWDGGVLHRQLFDPSASWNLATNQFQTTWLENPNAPESPTNPRSNSHSGPFYVNGDITNHENGLMESRRGYTLFDSTGAIDPLRDNSLLALDVRVPTFFANPFRASDAGSLVPLRNLQRPGSECTLMRRQAMSPGADGQWGQALNDDDSNGFEDDLSEFDANSDREDKDPLMAGTTDEAYNHGARNAYFGYQPATRLSSMTTTRSNVYAMWVTIGFFEVEEAPPEPDFATANNLTSGSPQSLALYQQVYPEGYAYGKEAGIDTGDVRRVRGFAVVDRTVPVAFEPGKNHNIEKAIRLWRRIE